MSKKEKKIFKPYSIISPKTTLNRKWTVWRQPESKNLLTYVNSVSSNISIASLSKDRSIEDLSVFRAFDLIFNKSVRSSISKPRNYCFYIGRSRGVDRSLFMSRHTIRRLTRFGLIPGIVKERC